MNALWEKFGEGVRNKLPEDDGVRVLFEFRVEPETVRQGEDLDGSPKKLRDRSEPKDGKGLRKEGLPTGREGTTR